MNLLDGVILIPILFFAIRGLQNGLIKEVLSLVGVILAIFISFTFKEKFALYLQLFFTHNRQDLPLVSFIILFLGTLLAVKLLIILLTKLIDFVQLSLPNRILGMLFGSLKTAIFLSIVLVLLAGFNLPDSKTRDSSLTYPYIIMLAPATFNIFATIYPEANNYANSIKRTIDHYQSSTNIQKIIKK